MADADDRGVEALRRKWSADLYTRSGTPIRIRPVDPQDRAQIETFFQHVDPEDLRFRFLATLRRVDEGRLDALCTLDPPRTVSFLAFSRDQLAAVATLAGDPDRGKAEIALSTRPEWKSQGISWTLFDHVIRYARAQGYEEIVSVEKSDNRAAIQLEQEMGFGISLIDDDGGEVVASKPILLN